jgi:trk system potassium uptake protein TrkA
MKVVIMGCGRVGARLASILDADGHQVTIMDINSRSFNRLPATFKGTTLIGDGTDEDSLISAGIQEANAFVAVTQGDNRNVMAAQIAKHIFSIRKVVCRVYDPLREELYQTLGLESICPTVIGAQLLKEKLLK